MDERELKARTRRFALRCIKLAESLPRTRSCSRTIVRQLIDCATAVGANYRAVCRSRSRAEFVARLPVVEEEADESGYWMELIVESALKVPRLVGDLAKEADELTRIMTASIITASSQRANPKSKVQNPK